MDTLPDRTHAQLPINYEHFPLLKHITRVVKLAQFFARDVHKHIEKNSPDSWTENTHERIKDLLRSQAARKEFQDL